jgi:hypothetical protein
MPSNDELWRSLLSPTNQNLLIYVLKLQFVDIYMTGIAANIISPTKEEQETLHNTSNDLSQICKLYFTSRFTNLIGDNKYNVNSIGYYLLLNSSSLNAANMTLAQAQLFRRRTIDIPIISRVIRDHRNYQAHDNSKINDEGNAALLASSILRLLEIIQIPEERESECGKLREETIRVLRTISELNQNETQSDVSQSEIHEVIRKAGNQKKKLSIQENDNEENGHIQRVEGPSKFSGTIGIQHLSPDQVVRNIARQVKHIEQQQEIIFPMVEQTLRSLHLEKPKESELFDKIANELRIISVGHEKLIIDLDKKVELALQNSLEETKEAIDDIAKQLPSTESDDDDGDWEEGEINNKDDVIIFSSLDKTHTSSGDKSTITRAQAKQRFMSLRNEIRQSYQIENWENILQGPIIDAMLDEQLNNIDEWKIADEISWRFEKHEAVMKLQLDKYWDRILDVLNSIEWKGSDWDGLSDDIPF